MLNNFVNIKFKKFKENMKYIYGNLIPSLFKQQQQQQQFKKHAVVWLCFLSSSVPPLALPTASAYNAKINKIL